MVTKTSTQPRLRLRRDSTPAKAADRSQEHAPLRFPTEAVRSLPAGGWGRADEGPEVAGVIGGRDLVRQIEDTLDFMQRKVDEVREEVDSAFRLVFPAPSDRQPPAAA